jgi:hypothetical protein
MVKYLWTQLLQNGSGFSSALRFQLVSLMDRNEMAVGLLRRAGCVQLALLCLY